MTDHRAPDRPPLVAPVGGFAAYAIGKVLDDALPARLVGLQRQVEAGRLHPDRLADVRFAWAAVRAAGREWASWRRIAVDGTAEVPPAVQPQDSDPEREIDTAVAAGLLGVSPRRVRQLAAAGHLPARRAGRVWLVDRCAVDLRRGT